MSAPSLGSGRKWYGCPPAFDPQQGETIVAPPGAGYGYWAGAPSATYSPDSGKFFLYYRLRTPLLDGRGGECRIAASTDGSAFETVWTATKEDFGANSIEKASLICDPSGRWRLYLSYEVANAYDRNPPTWRVDLLEADAVDQFAPSLSRPVIDAPMFGFSFVKDPTVLLVGGEYLVYVSVGVPVPGDRTGDGVIDVVGRGRTALCRSADGLRFPTAQLVLERPRHAWDGFQQRVSSVCYLPPVWLAFYDGASHRADSYDEFCGLAVGDDPAHLRAVSVDRPWVTSPHASGSIRYLDALPVGDTMHYFYEYARPDRSHELRHNAVPLTS